MLFDNVKHTSISQNQKQNNSFTYLGQILRAVGLSGIQDKVI